MSIARILAVGVVCALLIQTGVAQTATTQADPTAVPEQVIKDIRSRFDLPKGTSELVAMRLLQPRMEKVLKLGADLEKKYPKAPNLYLVRELMLEAAQFLAWMKNDAPSRGRILDIAKRIVESDVPVEHRVRPEWLILTDKLRTLPEAEKVKAEILAFQARYAGTKAATQATVFATALAARTGQTAVRDELAKKLETKHLESPGVRGFLRNSLGRHPDIGRTFHAELKTLDGETLKLPDDLKGKVVVVDFWATWCRPCLVALPQMRQLYDKYKPQGLEIVGISLDKPGTDLKEFVKSEKINWIHTFAGDGRRDPTAGRYGVQGIPNVWVIGPDGKVISDGALRHRLGHANLEAIVAKALRAAATTKKPATESATKPATKPAAKPSGKKN